MINFQLDYARTSYPTSKLNSVALVRTRTIPTECQLLRIEGCHVVSATGPHSR